MKLNDNIDFMGVFTIKVVHADGTIDEETTKNLIVNSARTNMAKLIGGQSEATPINKIVLGTQGHTDSILNYKEVGSDGFDTTRTQLFSEETDVTDYNNYSIIFDTNGVDDIVSVNGVGTMYLGVTEEYTDTTQIPITRTINDRTVTYSITIPAACANPSVTGSAIAYTEAALYAGDNMFSMKCYSARVKDSDVKLIISWSIVF